MAGPRIPPDDDVRGRLRELEVERDQLQTKFDAASASLAEAQAARQTLETLSKSIEERLTDAEQKLAEGQQALTTAQGELRQQEGELGRLRAVAETVSQLQSDLQSVRGDADELRRQLVETTANADKRVADQVQAAIERVRKEHEESAAQWQTERRQLEDRIKDLERDDSATQPERAMSTRELASQFRSVLDQLSEPEQTDAPAGAALTGLEVEARGLLVAPEEGEELPRIVPVDPAKVQNPEALSTVRLRFGLLPRLPVEGESQPPPR